MKTVTIAANDAGQRLDKFLTKYLSLPSGLLYRSIRKKRIKVNGAKTDGAYRLCEGDTLQLYLNDDLFEQKKSDAAVPIARHSVTVVYEDENILLVDKPAGQIVHDDDREQVNTTIAHIKAYLMEKGEYDPAKEQSFVPALCNRIDRNTAGIVIAAKNAAALRELNTIIKERYVEKYYQCLAVGRITPKSGTLTGYLVKDAASNRVTVYDAPRKGAVKAVTRYRVMEQHDTHCRVEVELLTGRTHQIRAQFAHMGHPLVGDGKYGRNAVNKQFGRTWQALCAYRLRFCMPEDFMLAYLNGRDFCVKKIPF